MLIIRDIIKDYYAKFESKEPGNIIRQTQN